MSSGGGAPVGRQRTGARSCCFVQQNVYFLAVCVLFFCLALSPRSIAFPRCARQDFVATCSPGSARARSNDVNLELQHKSKQTHRQATMTIGTVRQQNNLHRRPRSTIHRKRIRVCFGCRLVVTPERLAITTRYLYREGGWGKRDERCGDRILELLRSS